VADHPTVAATQGEADLRQLGGLSGAGLAGYDDHLVVADGGGDVVPTPADRKLFGKVDGGSARSPARSGIDRHIAHRIGQEERMTHTTLSPNLTLHGDVDIPQLGFGVFQVPSVEAATTVRTALEAGYRHIDTAKLYDNEEGVGTAVLESGLAREDVFVTTKLWNDDQGYDRARRAFDASLERLGLEYVDLYLIHWPCPAQDLYRETWRALEKVHADGQARAIGVSNFTAEHLRRLAAEADVLPSINQVELHPTMQQADLRAAHAELGIVTEAWAPLGKAQDLEDPVVREIAERVGRTPAQVVLRWHLQLGNVAIPKSVTPQRIRENFAVFDFELGDDDMQQMTKVNSDTRQGPDPDAFG